MKPATIEAAIERLSQHDFLKDVPVEELEWIAEQGAWFNYEAGEMVVKTGDIAPGLFIVLSGHIEFRIDRNLGPRKVMEWKAGDVTGTLPYSRSLIIPGDARAAEPTETWLVPGEVMKLRFARECPPIPRALD